MGTEVKMNVELPYELFKLKLTRARLDTMKQWKSNRPIRKSKVSAYLKVLEGGETFAGPIVINTIDDARSTGGKRRVVIDGNHRLLALELFFERHPTSVIYVSAHEYRNLTLEQEREVYDKYSDVISQTQFDRIDVHNSEIPILKMIKERFPCAVYLGGSGSRVTSGVFSLLTLLKSHLNRFAPRAVGLGTPELLPKLKALNETDHKHLISFAEFFIASFGKPGVDCMYSKASPLHALAKIFACNVDRLGTEEMVSRMRRKVLADSSVMQIIAVESRSVGNADKILDVIITALNRGYIDTDRFFITPTQYSQMAAGQQVVSVVKEI